MHCWVWAIRQKLTCSEEDLTVLDIWSCFSWDVMMSHDVSGSRHCRVNGVIGGNGASVMFREQKPLSPLTRPPPQGVSIGLPTRILQKKANEMDNCARLTWSRLWVSINNFKGEHQTVLHGVSGYAEPGEMLAIMGPSGSGKSTLLDSLAGRLSPNASLKGDILVNGRKKRLSYGMAVSAIDVVISSFPPRVDRMWTWCHSRNTESCIVWSLFSWCMIFWGSCRLT